MSPLSAVGVVSTSARAKLNRLTDGGEDEGQGHRSVCVRGNRILLSPGKDHDGRCRAEEFVGAKRPMKLRCVNRKKKPCSSLTSQCTFSGLAASTRCTTSSSLTSHDTRPHSNEIAKCKWFAPVKITTLPASVPTRGIVELFFKHIGILGPDNVRQPLQHVDRVTP